MTDDELEWLPLKAVRVLAGGKREYAEQEKDRLARYCICSGAPIGDLARRAGVNANLLRKWVNHARVSGAQRDASSFVPVAMPSMAAVAASTHSPLPALLSATLPNGVKLELALRGHDAELLRGMIAALAQPA
jgi:transposase